MTDDEIKAALTAVVHLIDNSEKGKPVTGADTDWLKTTLRRTLNFAISAKNYQLMYSEATISFEALQKKYDKLHQRHNNVCDDYELLRRKHEHLTRDSK